MNQAWDTRLGIPLHRYDIPAIALCDKPVLEEPFRLAGVNKFVKRTLYVTLRCRATTPYVTKNLACAIQNASVDIHRACQSQAKFFARINSCNQGGEDGKIVDRCA